ncbi:hypothetical protein AVEN_179652-1 [Araneus ventricosus]|uniref:Uncharacterized protein n=1 Tax=Araneus ventricosus TaxID=182803 RepID=A0A4Y2W3F4_ARAVE|nr:hypothetical protein AVEN_179652-1 [Araneus ventricosus]
MAGLPSLISPLRVPLMTTRPTAFSPFFGAATGRIPPHWYRSCMAGYGRLRSQSVKIGGKSLGASDENSTLPFTITAAHNPHKFSQHIISLLPFPHRQL